MQTIGWWARPISFLERCRAEYGNRFTIRLLATPPFVMIADPAQVKEIFTADPQVLHPGEGARILEPVVGKHSVILLDEGEHLSQRKLMLPAFHGEKMQRLASTMQEVADQEAASWPTGRPIELHSRFQALTLEVILRAVFGLDAGPQLDGLRVRLNEMLNESAKPATMIPFLQRGSKWEQFERTRSEADELIFELIDRRRAEDEERDDILSMLLGARHEDGTPMSHQELRDELMTLLVAGHETTASELAWAIERLAREPAVVKRLHEEIDSGDGDAYVTATIQETLRRRPVLPNAAPRLVKEPIEIGGWTYPPGVCLVANAYLIHHDPEIYPDPYAFRPERFLEDSPGTYTWIPFGGGRRRCLGATFALQEMKIVLKSILSRYDVAPARPQLELTRRRAITISPGRGAEAVLHARTPAAEPAPVAVAA
ncbi:MAG TPA: cytochrome P450 [Solirubrobacterales bacterium]|nr:cytochrome P450 [Solirubrobacterales bacterium]